MCQKQTKNPKFLKNPNILKIFFIKSKTIQKKNKNNKKIFKQIYKIQKSQNYPKKFKNGQKIQKS